MEKLMEINDVVYIASWVFGWFEKCC